MSKSNAGSPRSKAKRSYTSTEASRQAARENGKLSKGGRTTASRKAGALNALKDGCFASTLIIGNEKQSDLDALVQMFIQDAKAVAPLEVEFATAAAHARWRNKRVINADASALRCQIHDAEIGDEEQRNRNVATLARELISNSAHAVAKLRETTEGCLYLINQWAVISNMLEVENLICRSHHRRAVALLGKAPTEMFSDPDVEDWARNYLGSYPRDAPRPIDVALAHTLFDAFQPEDMAPLDFDGRLRHMVDELPSRDKALAFFREQTEKAMTELFDRFGMLEVEENVRRQMDIGAAHAADDLKASRRLRQEQVYRSETMTMMAAAKELRQERLAEPAAGGSGEPSGGVAEGAVGDPKWVAQNDPKSVTPEASNSDVDLEVMSSAEAAVNPNWDWGLGVRDWGADGEIDASSPESPTPDPEPPTPNPEFPTPDPESPAPSPRLIDVRDDPPYNYVAVWPVQLVAEWSKAAAAAGEGPDSAAEESDTPSGVAEAPPLPLGAAETVPVDQTAMPAPTIAPEPSGEPAAPAAVPTPDTGHPIASWPPRHPPRGGDPRLWPGGQVPPHLRPPPRGQPPTAPGRGHGFNPRDG